MSRVSLVRFKSPTWSCLVRAAVVTALLALPACGDDSGDDGPTHPEACEAADTLAPNLSKTGSAGITVTIVEATPAVPGINMDNVWNVRVTDSSGTAVEGATLQMDQDMPAHGHGVPRQAISTEQGGGLYELEPILFTMDGLWTVPIDVTKGELRDRALFELCIGE
ncbi:MAG TPA: FixH family protein [Polyangiaceae bacterium]